MNKVALAIAVSFIALFVVFVRIGGSFDHQFWLAFLPGLMENLVILSIAVFVIDFIFRKQRLEKLELTNAGQTRIVLFVNNRLAFLILEYLALATKDEIGSDPDLNLQFALDRLRNTDLSAIFQERLVNSQNKEDFVKGFADLLSRGAEAISKTLDQIYPRPEPAIKQISDQVSSAAGSLEFLKGLFHALDAANLQLGADQQFEHKHVDVLVKIAYEQVGPAIRNMQSAVLRLSDKAKVNQLFISLD